MIIHKKKLAYTFTGGLILVVSGMSEAAVDPLEKKLYYTVSSGKSVNVIKLETGEEKKLVNTAPDSPLGLALDRTER